jgi:hypothetical protein
VSDIPDEVRTLTKKLAKATAEMAAVTKTKQADMGSYSYTYATLTDVLQTVKDALDKQDLALTQPLITEDGIMKVTTLILDKDTGESMSFGGPGITLKADPQAMGGAITYYRRYALTSLFALEVDDDDGHQAARAVTQTGKRTGAEVEIRALLASWDKDVAAAFASDFQERFHSTLTHLPESQHGDALAWTKLWEAGEPETSTTTEEFAQDEARR